MKTKLLILLALTVIPVGYAEGKYNFEYHRYYVWNYDYQETWYNDGEIINQTDFVATLQIAIHSVKETDGNNIEVSIQEKTRYNRGSLELYYAKVDPNEQGMVVDVHYVSNHLDAHFSNIDEDYPNQFSEEKINDTSFIVTSTTTTQTSISSPKHINEWTWIYDRDTGLADYLYVNLSTITEEYNYVRERTDTFAGEGNKISYFEYTSPLVLVFGGILFVAIVILILKFDLFKRSYN